MAEGKVLEQTTQPRPTLGQRAKRAGLYLLFGTILFIPRIRRLRRKVWAWTLVRLTAAMSGVWLIWQFAHLRGGSASMVAGLVLFVFGLLVRARPVEKSVDEVAKELGALVVLNGGTFVSHPPTEEVRKCRLFINSKDVIVCDPRHRQVASIPLSKFRSLEAIPSANGKDNRRRRWEVKVDFDADGTHTATFVYDGQFAEHLAQVAELTLRGQWKKELPVLQ